MSFRYLRSCVYLVLEIQSETHEENVECIMTILIYKNLVKGYLAHKSKMVVLSKQYPFPKLNGKPVGSQNNRPYCCIKKPCFNFSF
ncbi:hypothetical protein YC2023_114373 [Brassica napus]